MARGAHSPAPTLPKVSFVKVEDDFSKKAAGVHDQQQRSYGCAFCRCFHADGDLSTFIDNDFAEFQRPDAYIHYIGVSPRASTATKFAILYFLHAEPLEVELAKQVEYDMDEQGTALVSYTFTTYDITQCPLQTRIGWTT